MRKQFISTGFPIQTVKKTINATKKSTGCIWHLHFFVIVAALPSFTSKEKNYL